MKLGIVGLPNVGKSTLFNSLTKAGAESANYPFCTIDPNIGIVAVPDERLKLLGDMYQSRKVTPAVIEFVDIAGLVKGASKGEGILRLAQILGVRAEETMAFGDGENDLSMMEKAGISIAMENGEASIQEKADYIAPCNNDAGVAQMLEKMVLS